MTTTTGADGHYIARDVPPGKYQIQVEAQGFATARFDDVQVIAGKALLINAPMQIASGNQSVLVTESAPLIDVTTTQVGHTVTSEEFNMMPKARSFQSLAVSSPSVTSGDLEGGIQVNGASGAENNFMVDGITTSSLIQGQSRQNAAFEILQEVQVKTSGIEAQYGGATGGVISAITKSGGAQFHGDVHYYFRGNGISAGPVHRLFMNPNDLVTVTYQQDNKQHNSTHEAGYSLGGYIPGIKGKKVTFFSAASPQFQSRDQLYLSSDNQNIALHQDTTFWQAYNKVSADITDKLRANASFYWSPNHQEGAIPSYTGTGNRSTSSASSLLANQIRGTFSPQSNYNADINYTVTPTSLFTIRFARFWDDYKALGVPDISPIVWGTPSTGITAFQVPADLQRAQNSLTLPQVQNTIYDLATRTQVNIDFSKFLTAAGTHDFKVGVSRMKAVNKVNNAYGGGGYVTLFWDTAFQDISTGKQYRGQYGYYTVDDNGTKGTTGGNIDSFYVQDRWRIKRRLSLDLGIRMENETVPSFRRDIQDYAFKFGWGDKIAPRIGASFDVFGNGKLKIYGSYGMFYDWIKYELARGTFGGDVWRTYYRTLDTLDVLKLGNGNVPGTNIWAGGASAFQDHRIPSFGKNVLDPNLKPFSSDLISIGTEYQLAAKVVVSARYTRNHLRQAIEDVGTLDSTGSEVYIYGNPGQGLTAKSSPSGITPSFALPRPKRDYNALELSFNRRFANRYFLSGSYVLSRLYGNYSGIASTDEVNPPATGRANTVAQQNTSSSARPGTSASRYYDLDYLQYDSKGNFDILGRLGSDRPHQFKLYGSYQLPWSVMGHKAGYSEIGGFFLAQSGTPASTYVNTLQNAPVFANGRGDMGRTPMVSQTDIVISHTFPIKEGKEIRIEFNAQNLFNQKTAQLLYNYLNRYRTTSSAIDLTSKGAAGVNFTKGYDYMAMIKATGDATTKAYGAFDPRYGYGDLFRPGFSGRLGVKFTF